MRNGVTVALRHVVENALAVRKDNSSMRPERTLCWTPMHKWSQRRKIPRQELANHKPGDTRKKRRTACKIIAHRIAQLSRQSQQGAGGSILWTSANRRSPAHIVCTLQASNKNYVANTCPHTPQIGCQKMSCVNSLIRRLHPDRSWHCIRRFVLEQNLILCWLCSSSAPSIIIGIRAAICRRFHFGKIKTQILYVRTFFSFPLGGV